MAGKSQLLVIKWAVLKASRRDLVSGSCVAAFPRTSSAWPVICSHTRYDPVRYRAFGQWAFGLWVGTTLAPSVTFLAMGLGSKPRPAEPQCYLRHRRYAHIRVCRQPHTRLQKAGPRMRHADMHTDTGHTHTLQNNHTHTYTYTTHTLRQA